MDRETRGLPWTEKELQAFSKAAESLKLYRRAELQDEDTGVSLIKDLYVDPLPANNVFSTLMKPNTSFLIGRKGTGKSTIFQRVQAELRHKVRFASAYVDIKTVYESSVTDSDLAAKLSSIDLSLPQVQLERLILYRAFLGAIVSELKDQLKKRVEESLWARIKNTFSGSLEELTQELDDLLDAADEGTFTSVLAFKQVQLTSSVDKESGQSSNQEIAVSVSASPSATFKLGDSGSSQSKFSDTSAYSDLLMRIVDVKVLISRLKAILTKVDVAHLYIFIDDFSELPEDAMQVVVDTLLAPLNNWSDELIKFKVAAYPGRIYFGQIDVTKADLVYLDLFNLYGATDKTEMEEKAIDFIRRLVDSRLSHFGASSISHFVDSDDPEVWELMFYASTGNPRNLGHILYYLYQSHLIYGRTIGRRAIRDSAKRYYEEKIEHYFRVNKFLHESFAERSSIYSLKELLEDIVRRAQELRNYRGSAVMRGIEGQPPTSHFLFPWNLNAYCPHWSSIFS